MINRNPAHCRYCHGTADVLDLSGACISCAHAIRHAQWRAALWLALPVLALVSVLGLLLPNTAHAREHASGTWSDVLAELDREIERLQEEWRSEQALREELAQERRRNT
jgi:hypothetical protein